MSSSRSSTRSNSTQETTTTNLNLQDSAGGVAISSARDVTLTDGGAIAGMTDVSKNALDLGGRAIDSGASIAVAGLDYAQAAYENSLDMAGGALQAAIAQSAQIAASTTTQDSERIQKVAMWGIGAAVLALVLPKLLKGAA